MIIALNNKCNLSKKEFELYQKELSNIKENDSKLILCPTATYLALYNLSNMELGSQNVSKNNLGAHTGEIAASQLASLNVKYCIVGHSERRNDEHEDLETVNLKVKNLLNNHIIPILCVGETKEEKEKGQTRYLIAEQIKTAIASLTPEEKSKIIVAYEPIWSIGTGLIPTIDDINMVLSLIKEILPMSKTLYGGSANDENIDYLKKCKLIDGYLLGGLSLKPEKLQIFINKAQN
ncbi:MAG: triose-phosphate isomerase [bacterium]|nr:triose-phosphate isomerase [bacterium]